MLLDVEKYAAVVRVATDVDDHADVLHVDVCGTARVRSGVNGSSVVYSYTAELTDYRRVLDQDAANATGL